MKSGKHFLLAMAAAVIFTLVGCGDKTPPRSTIEPGVLRVGVAPPYPPFVYKKPLRGLDVSLARALAREEKLRPKLIRMNFSALLPALRNQKIDIALSALVPRPEGSEEIAFSDPYLEQELLLFGQEGTEVGVIKDNYAQGWTQEEKVDFPTIGSLLQAFKKGQVEAILIGQRKAALSPFLQKQTPTKKYPLGGAYVVALREDSEGLRVAINDSLEQMKKKGALEKIMQRWLGAQAG